MGGVTKTSFRRVYAAEWDRERNIYSFMRQRCLNPKRKDYPHYGGRDIRICDRWLASVQNFLDDMGHAPPGLELERINNDGNYEPANCRWASRAEQRLNTRRSRRLTHNGKTMCAVEWAAAIGIGISTIKGRIRKGWSDERIITTPVGRQGSKTEGMQ